MIRCEDDNRVVLDSLLPESSHQLTEILIDSRDGGKVILHVPDGFRNHLHIGADQQVSGLFALVIVQILLREHVKVRVGRIKGHKQRKWLILVFNIIDRHLCFVRHGPFPYINPLVDFRIVFPVVGLHVPVIAAVGVPEIKSMAPLSRRCVGIPDQSISAEALCIRILFGLRGIQMPFSDITHLISARCQKIRQAYLIIVKIAAFRRTLGGAVGKDVVFVRVHTRKQDSPVRAADRISADGFFKYHRFTGKPVQIRRDHRVLLHIADSLTPELVTKYV